MSNTSTAFLFLFNLLALAAMGISQDILYDNDVINEENPKHPSSLNRDSNPRRCGESTALLKLPVSIKYQDSTLQAWFLY